MDSIIQLLISVGYIVPFFLIYSVGIVLSLVKRNIPPRNARFAMAGFGLLLINTIINAGRMIWFVFFATSYLTAEISTVSMILNTITTLFAIAGTLFLLAAIFFRKDQ